MTVLGTLIKVLAPSVGMLAGLAVVGGVVVLTAWRWRRAWKSPLTDRTLRPPGFGTSERFVDALMKLCGGGAFGLLLPMVAAGRVAADPAPAVWVTHLLVLLVVAGPLAWWLARQTRTVIRLKVGRDAEVAAAVELDRLMLDGWRVFHDLPDRRCGNIDHALVGPGGIYAVETKGYAKRAAAGADAREEATARYDPAAGTLRLGTRTRPLPVAQLERSAAALTALLTERLGEPPPAPVEPVLCLPGWFVIQTGRGTPVAFNPKAARGWVTPARPRLTRPLPPRDVNRLANTLDDFCRTRRPDD